MKNEDFSKAAAAKKCELWSSEAAKRGNLTSEMNHFLISSTNLVFWSLLQSSHYYIVTIDITLSTYTNGITPRTSETS